MYRREIARQAIKKRDAEIVALRAQVQKLEAEALHAKLEADKAEAEKVRARKDYDELSSRFGMAQLFVLVGFYANTKYAPEAWRISTQDSSESL